jgi:Holliday junction resolvase
MSSVEILMYAILLGIGGWAALFARKWIAAFTMKRRFAIGARAEEDAVTLLEMNGYAILETQASDENVFLVDGEETISAVRADYIAEKEGKRFVVEVKSGKSAPSPTNSATRRQLLEYEHVFRPDGLILADMHEGKLKRIEFGLTGEPLVRNRSPLRWKHLFWALVAGVVLGLLL